MKLLGIHLLLLIGTATLSAQTYQQIGNTTYGSDGVSYQKIGNTT